MAPRDTLTLHLTEEELLVLSDTLSALLRERPDPQLARVLHRVTETLAHRVQTRQVSRSEN